MSLRGRDKCDDEHVTWGRSGQVSGVQPQFVRSFDFKFFRPLLDIYFKGLRIDRKRLEIITVLESEAQVVLGAQEGSSNDGEKLVTSWPGRGAIQFLNLII